MKSLFTFTLLLISPLATLASGILIQAPGSSPTEYQKLLSSQTHRISYSQSRVENYQTNVGQENRIYAIADEIPFSISRFLQGVRELRSDAPLTSMSWNFLADFLPRVEISTVLPAQRPAFQDLLCQAQLFTGKNVFSKCNHDTVSLRGLKSLFPQLDTLYVEGRIYTLEDQLPLPKTAELHWVLLSNSYKEIHFYGNFEQLRRQEFKFEELVTGNCDSFAMKENSFEIATRGSVFFNESCVLKTSQVGKEKTWLERNQTWVVIVGAALVGAAAYQMKDKPIVIDTPSLTK
jgi:hypothetical protein